MILCLSGCVTIRREKTALMIYFGSFPLNGIPENLRWLCFVTQSDKHSFQLSVREALIYSTDYMDGTDEMHGEWRLPGEPSVPSGSGEHFNGQLGTRNASRPLRARLHRPAPRCARGNSRRTGRDAQPPLESAGITP